jgi:hypothetical protein
MKNFLFMLGMLPALASASKTLDEGSYRPEVLRSSETRQIEPGLADRLVDIYVASKAPASAAGKETPQRPTILLQLIGYLTATVVVEKIQMEPLAVAGKPAAITVTGEIEGDTDSRAQLIIIGDSLVGSIRLEGGETYLLDSKSPGRYVVEELKTSWQVSAQSEND